MMDKLYWKGRKIKNLALFHIKSFLYRRRKRWQQKKEDMSFEKSVAWEVVKAFMKNALLVAIILAVESALSSEKVFSFFPDRLQNLQDRILGLNANIMADRGILSDVLAAIIGVAGVFLGLYCANIMSMFAEKYANAPQKISRLFENDIISNKCIREITNYLIFTVMILFLLTVQADMGVVMLLVCAIKGLKIIVSFGFMSRRTYQFSDMYYVTNAVYTDMYRVLQNLTKGKLFVWDKNFQNHHKKQIKQSIEILKEVNGYNLEKEEKSSLSVEEFMKKNLTLLHLYWKVKASVPFDSLWYDNKVVYKKWYSASDSEIAIALQSGTLIGHDMVKNYYWFEEEIESINDRCLTHMISQKSYMGLIRWLDILEGLAKGAVESGNLSYYVDYLYRLQQIFQNLLVEKTFSTQEEMGLAEYMAMGYIAVLVDVRKYLEKQKKEQTFCDAGALEKKNWKVPDRYYNYADVKKVFDGVQAEVKLEGKRITPDWYINQIAAKHYYDELLIIYDKINKAVNQYIPELAGVLVKNGKNAGAVVVFAKFSEVRSKVSFVAELLDEQINGVLKFHKEKTIIWDERPDMDMAEKFEEVYKGIFTGWCKCTADFVLEHWDKYDDYPDILGACAAYLCEILIDAIVDNDFETFSSNYKNLLEILLLYQEYSRRELLKIRESYRESAVFAVYSNPIIEYSEISGYAYLWGEICGDNRWKELVVNDAKEKIAGKDLGKIMCTVLQSLQKRMPALYNRDILHTTWRQRVEYCFRHNENLQWKRTRFAQVYDGSSQLLKAVLGEKDRLQFLRCEAFEIFAIMVLNPLVSEEDRYHSQYGWEEMDEDDE